jgi:PPOX class probable FMN-dependent enzyme
MRYSGSYARERFFDFPFESVSIREMNKEPSMTVTASSAANMTLIENEAALRALIGEPGDRARRKQLPKIDSYAREFIGRSPMAMLASTGSDGSSDVSPRGDGPGFVIVLNDRQLAIPERPGNRRADSYTNILQNGGVGLLFLIPGMEETLRVNGRARLVLDAPWFADMVVQGKRPILAIVIDVEEAYFHCAKAFRRSRLWEPETWPDRSTLPTLGQILKDQVNLEKSVAELDCDLEESYAETMY